jgi:hypothetical protein
LLIIFLLSLTAFVGFCEVIAPYYKIAGKWGAFEEWFAFDLQFIFYIVLATMMPYNETLIL